MGDDPPFLSVGTEVSAKYKGAFCEAKVRKVVKSIKCKVMFKLGLGSAVVSDDQIKGLLRVGAQVEAKHPEKAQFVEAVINKIQDCSQYTVVFDDGDITTLRRTSLCLKSGRHFAESETLDQLPLTHPEHFGTPVLGGRRGGRRRDESSDEDGDEDSELGRPEKSALRKTEDREPNIGKIVCVEVSDKKKGKEAWFPGLIVAPTAQDAVSIRVKDEYLVRSFKDARYYTVPKKEAMEFTREIALKTEHNALKTAIEKAMQYLDKNELPAHWDREALFGLDDASSINESKGGSDADSSEEETPEEKDHFVAQLYKFMDDNGTPINKGPTINSRDLDLYRLFKIVNKMGGFNRVTNQNGWKVVTKKLILNSASNSSTHVKQAYKKYLYGFEDFYRKLGCTMNSPRGAKSRARPGRSLIRDRDRGTSGSSTPKGDLEEEEKIKVEDVPSVSPSTQELVPMIETAVVVDEETISVTVEEEEVDESSSSVSQPPPRKQRERSLPLRLQDTITTKLVVVKKEEESGGDEAIEQEVESNSSQSVRSQRGTRSRIPREKSDESEQPETNRSARKRGKSRLEDKTTEEDEKTSRVKVKEETTNGKEDSEKKSKENTEKKNKTPGREPKNRGRKSEDAGKVEEPKMVEEEPITVDQEEPTPKRRGRKPRVLGDSEEDEGGRLPANVDVQIGDKLKVYYGDKPIQDSKVTYEAKVCEIRCEGSSKLYLVHYTGWNTRYDEWIKRARIAENLTWTPNRKRSKSVHGQGTIRTSTSAPTGKAVPAKRGRTRGQDSSRSATPSSVTSTSSTGQRNANLASGEDSGNKIPPTKNSRRRSRRISEISGMSAESMNSSDDEEEEGTVRVRKKPTKKVASANIESEESEPVDVEESDRTPRRRHQRRRISEAEQMPSENKIQDPPVVDISASVTTLTPVRRGRRRAVTAPESAVADPVPIKEEQVEEEKTSEAAADLISVSEEEPKGKDFDLKKIRSELKMPVDIAATTIALKVSSPVPPSLPPPPIPIAVSTVPTTSTVLSPMQQQQHAVESQASASGRGDDDIYEFREPEPFEFEVRTRRESPFSEDRVHHRFTQRKTTKEEEEDPSPKKTNAMPVRSGSNERSKSVITSPPRGGRPCSTAITVPVVPPEESELTQETPTASCPSPVASQPSDDVISIAPFSNAQSPPPPPSPLPTLPTLPIGPASPKAVDPPVEEEILTKEQPQASAVNCLDLAPPIASPSPVLPMPAIPAIAARPVMAASSAPVVFAHKSTSLEVKLRKAAEEHEDDNGDADEEEDGVEEDSPANDTKSNRLPSKRERRKAGARKAISREFIESDEDSPEDPGAASDTTANKVVDDEKTSSDSTPSEIAEDDEPADKDNEPDCLLAVRKHSPNCSSPLKLKTDEDLDENSLLCEETIPGSPVTHSTAPSLDGPDISLPTPSTSRSTEMPFASAPSAPNMPRTRGLSGGNNSAPRANRKRGLRQALAMQRPGCVRPLGGPSLVLENTPPTTPDGSISSSSSSPQGDHGGMSPDHDSSVKSDREFSENDNAAPSPQVLQNTVEIPLVRNIGPRASATAQPVPTPVLKRREDEVPRQMQQQHPEEESPVKRRRRGVVMSACDPNSARKGRGHGRSPRRTGSDSEDTTPDYVNSSSIVPGCINLTNYQPRSTRYNFCTDLDPELDATQRIASLQDKLRELRQTYSALKAKVMLIDRRRKKLKRKEKEAAS